MLLLLHLEKVLSLLHPVQGRRSTAVSVPHDCNVLHSVAR